MHLPGLFTILTCGSFFLPILALALALGRDDRLKSIMSMSKDIDYYGYWNLTVTTGALANRVRWEDVYTTDVLGQQSST